MINYDEEKHKQVDAIIESMAKDPNTTIRQKQAELLFGIAQLLNDLNFNLQNLINMQKETNNETL